MFKGIHYMNNLKSKKLLKEKIVIVDVKKPRGKKSRGKAQARVRKIIPCTKLSLQYLGSLLDPFAVRTARIPDQITTSSAVCSLTYTTTLTPVQGSGSATGTWAAGICFYPECCMTATGRSQNSIAYLQPATAGGNGWFYPNQPSIFTSGNSDEFYQQPPLFGITNPGLASSYRVVSASIAGWASTSLLNNSGWGTAWSIDYGQAGTAPLFNPPVGFTTSGIVNLSHADRVPTQEDQVVGVNYWPSDQAQYQYGPGTNNNYALENYSAMGLFFVTGAPVTMPASSTPTIEVKIVMNIEYMVSPGFAGTISTSASRYCVTAMEQAVNARPERRRFTINPKSVDEFTVQPDDSVEGDNFPIGDFDRDRSYGHLNFGDLYQKASSYLPSVQKAINAYSWYAGLSSEPSQRFLRSAGI
jgi:hypothetical protein